MTMQLLIVFLLVTGCSVYALWALLPVAARRFIANQLVQLPFGSAWKARFQKAGSAASGCDCSGCDKVVDQTQKAKPIVIRFYQPPGK
jgi:hypothetical protein